MQLGQHTLKFYDRQLEQLQELVMEMGTHVRQMVLSAKKSLTTPSEGMVEQALTADQQINALDQRIEEEATAILALQNPMAVDLRFVTSTLKIASMLERAGDLAKNTVKRAAKLAQSNHSPRTLEKLEAMADAVVAMIDDALLAFKERDAARAIAVWKRDDVVDELYHQIFTSMQSEMATNGQNVPACTHVVFAAKNFERIADYTTNLSKMVYYVTSGKRADKAIIKDTASATSSSDSRPTH
jgi:phosphate transport system protein